ncbi:hypothetical protein [Exiguobacterium sp. s191]|uniref:phage neck terminator protein n=1 Tax=Exiguobacterium sp. s191 TaxID=2751196 RepID=UPI0020369FBD|nr:hypothetical protein [Exiguobacterium sp. s191]
MINYREIKRILVQHIKTHTGHEVILQGSNDTQPAYPFCAYTLTSPYLPVSEAEVDGQLIEDVEMVFSFTWHSTDATEVQELAHQTVMLFKLTQHRQALGDLGISFVKVEGIQSRDTFLSIDTERKYGVDIRFRTRHIETSSGELIETVEYEQQL